MPGFNSLTQKNLSFQSLLNWKIISGFITIFLITGLLGGSYPAFNITRFNLLQTIKGIAVNIGIASRDFSIEAGTDHLSAFIVNEKAVAQFGWESPEKALGKEIVLEGKQGNVIGVIKDFHFLSLRLPVDVLIMEVNVPVFNTFSIKVAGQDMPQTMSFIEEKWKSVFPEKTFEYDFLDDAIASQYQADHRLGKIIGIFALLTILVSCLGTYGLSMIHARQREKEISIRKILGASVAHIMMLLTSNYMKLMVIASLIAVPLTLWLMLRWLANFAYRTPVKAWLFAVAVLLVLLIAVVSISYQTIKSALVNPADALKRE